jgi:enamine deaminase RidA (YjgF/YER057c/UK114 family)
MATTASKIQRLNHSSFSSSVGIGEHFLTVFSPESMPLDQALAELLSNYNTLCNENKLDDSTIQFSRVYLSDITNDIEIVKNSEILSKLKKGVVSFIEQSPLNCGPAILSYHIKSEDKYFYKKDLIGDTSDARRYMWAPGKNYSLLWSTLNAQMESDTDFKNTMPDIVKGYQHPDSEKQTNSIFEAITSVYSKYGMNIRNNLQRTWIFVRDIDNNYGGMVKARRELFEKVGLNKNTRYISSTGIEGKSADHSSLVTIDAFGIKNIKEEQIVRIEALQNLSSTISYGVTFERGTRFRFGDRSHIHISGTASIDNKGNILHISDIRNQTHRTLDNVEALLAGQGATISDMKYIIIYLRNPKHYNLIQDILTERIPETVLTMPVFGPVCRPGWLIEMEGQGIMPDTTEFAPFA